jgi:hypothetical protein
LNHQRATDGAPRGGNGQPAGPPIDRHATAPERRQAERFPLVTSAALDSQDYTPRWIITGVMAALVPMFIGGLFKTCKTLLAVAQAIAIASGRPFLEIFEVPEATAVIYFNGEGGPTVAQDYARRVARSMGLELRDVTNLHWCFSIPRLESLSDLDAFCKVLDETRAKVVVLDNTTLAMSGENAGNAMAMGGIFSHAIDLCNQRGVTPVFVHHFKRNRADQFAPGDLSDLTQAGAAEVAGQWILATRHEAYNPEQPGEHRLWLNIGGRLGHGCLHALDIHEGRLSDPGGRRWEVEVLQPHEVRQGAAQQAQAVRDGKRQADREARNEAAKKAILQAMAELGPAAKTKIMNASGVHQRDFAGPFGELIQSGDVVPCEVHAKNRKKPYDGFALAGSPAATPTLAQVWDKI